MTEQDNPIMESQKQADSPLEEILIWEGCPKWQADFAFILKSFFIIAFGLLLLIFFVAKSNWITFIPTFVKVLLSLGVSLVGFLMFTYIRLKRKNERFKITTLNLEFEEGIFSKTVNNMEMWRVRDIKYMQSFLDRLLGVSKVLLITQDPTTPEILLEGLPPGAVFTTTSKRPSPSPSSAATSSAWWSKAKGSPHCPYSFFSPSSSSPVTMTPPTPSNTRAPVAPPSNLPWIPSLPRSLSP